MFTPNDLERFRKIGTAPSELASTVSKFYVDQQMKLTGVPGGSIPDLAVMAFVVRPDLFLNREMWVDVDNSQGLSRGAMVAGSPSYLRYDMKKLILQEMQEHGETMGVIPGEPGTLRDAPGRAINVPKDVDAPAVVALYEKLLAKGESL
jgi:inosine-uridine nucleoside N-ribohydrolase